jgi:peroxiredoxin
MALPRPSRIVLPEPEPDRWVGRTAPDFVLQTLDGSKLVRLADMRGRNVVVLDFFATWCGPCRASMPELIEMAEQFKPDGMVLFAVNQQEGREKVSRMLQRMGNPQVNVLLDSDGRVGDSYGVDSIPRTVVIGRDGIIKAAYTGSGIGGLLYRDIQKALR